MFNPVFGPKNATQITENPRYSAHIAGSGKVRLPSLEPKYLSNQTRYRPSFYIKSKLITWRCAHESLSVL